MCFGLQSMKEFYEGKLHQMEQLLEQKEDERMKLIIELERLKANNSDTREVEAQIKKQEEHIEGIRKQKRQLKDLTAVSSKNASEIKKLQNDVRSMKERKVAMQRQLAEERKAHANEIKMLKKQVLQKDRETLKWKRQADRKMSEAERATQMAKAKMGQLGQLRAKYKDAEKTIRMLQIKKGVMAKAGLDSVIVGRRDNDRKGKPQRDQTRGPSNDARAVDVDSLRDYFDSKVAEVGRKEALADKVARGWEEHFQLTWKRTELAQDESEESKEELQALDLRIKYEEDRIRKLANKLGKRQPVDLGEENCDQVVSFLYGTDFKKICNGTCSIALAISFRVGSRSVSSNAPLFTPRRRIPTSGIRDCRKSAFWNGGQGATTDRLAGKNCIIIG
jgi:myosin heavy subunit